uniref:Metal dependent phosphohydrolase n=1 Tax=Nitratidesulfovibrio vulgaris (strain DSM 19637 / Miyazaki F) TaxID=883 RepID=B8DRK0_NITV9
MQQPLEVRLIDLTVAFSRALDLVSPAVAAHHVHVGFIAARLAERLGLPDRDRCELLLASLMHDAGAVPLKAALEGLVFEQDMDSHSRAGAVMLGTCPRLAEAARLVRHHHAPWCHGRKEDGVPAIAHLIHLADRLVVQLRRDEDPARQFSRALKRLERGRSILFRPDALDALHDLTVDPDFAAGLRAPECHLHTGAGHRLEGEVLDADGIISFSALFSLVIDSRSPFTATHSSGVAETARLLARWAGFDGPQGKALYVAGLLHDIGKLGVPLDILEKPGRLDEQEMAGMRRHAAHSMDILASVPGFTSVATWGALHHERMDGSGYPYGLTGDDLPLPARIVAVADVFTAIAEDRPYRRGMPPEAARAVLRDQARDGKLDGGLVDLLLSRYEEMDDARRQAQERARHEFGLVRAALEHEPDDAVCREPAAQVRMNPPDHVERDRTELIGTDP